MAGLLRAGRPGGTGDDGLVPFLIDWKDSPHPSASTPQGCTLVSLRGEHPDPAAVWRAGALA